MSEERMQVYTVHDPKAFSWRKHIHTGSGNRTLCGAHNGFKGFTSASGYIVEEGPFDVLPLERFMCEYCKHCLRVLKRLRKEGCVR